MDKENLAGVTVNGDAKVPTARVFPSTRLTLALIFLLATWNFMFQRLTINFGLVCMVKTPPLHAHEDILSLSLSLTSNDSIINATNTNPNVIDDEHILNATDAEISSCPLLKPPNANASSNFEEGEFEWSRDVQGLILAAFYYGFVFAQIPGGWCSDRFGAKLALLMSGLSLSLLTMLTPIASHLGPEYLIALRLISGLANGAAMPAISSMSARWFADIERGFMVGIAYSGFGFATATAYPISAFFCEYAGWSYLFYFAGSLGLLWCIATYFLIFDWPENHPNISQTEFAFIKKHRAVQYGGPARQKLRIPWFSILTSGPVYAVCVANFTCFWLFLTMSMYLPTYFKEVLYLDISENGLLSALPFCFMMSFHFVVAVCFDRLRKRNLCSVTRLRKFFNTLGSLAAAAAMFMIGFLNCENIFGSVALITIGQVMLEFAFMGGYIFSIFEMAPKFAGTLTAVMNTFGLIVGLLSPPLVAYLTPNRSREEWLLVFYISAGICAFGGVFYLLFGSAELQPWASSGNPKKNGTQVDSPLADKELKTLQIRLINGQSNINGEVVKS